MTSHNPDTFPVVAFILGFALGIAAALISFWIIRHEP